MLIGLIVIAYLAVGIAVSRVGWATDVAPIPETMSSEKRRDLISERRQLGTEGQSIAFVLVRFFPTFLVLTLLWPIYVIMALLAGIRRPESLRRFVYSVIHARLP